MAQATESDKVLVEIDDGLMTITINRPEVRNAVDRAVSYGVCAAVDELDARPDLRVAILTGAGGTFCSGMDLKAFLRGEVTRVEGRGILGIARTPPEKPLIAAVEGTPWPAASRRCSPATWSSRPGTRRSGCPRHGAGSRPLPGG
jgi:enoyl-CoA hydratase/carnithine racemase